MKNRKAIEQFNSDIEDLMIGHANKNYYFDLESLMSHIGIKDKDGELVEINAPKYEIYKMLIEIVVSPIEEEVEDQALASLGMEKRPLDFKIAYNTLIKDEILKNYE
jgi:hypothetical protein